MIEEGTNGRMVVTRGRPEAETHIEFEHELSIISEPETVGATLKTRNDCEPRH